MSPNPAQLRTARLCFIQTFVLVILGLVPLPLGWARSVRDAVRSASLNRSDSAASAGGYYQGLIGCDGPVGAPPGLTARLRGSKSSDWGRIYARYVSQGLKDDFLMFELRPNVKQDIFDQPFTTNEFGMRDRPYALAKPKKFYRIAVLGSSIDMGWGVRADAAYVNRLEDWLNSHAAKRGLDRRFEVLNFAVAAYSPMQRLESFRRKAVQFQPDLVLYSATMLDTRLMEIHLCDMLGKRVDLKYDFLRHAIGRAGMTEADLKVDSQRDLVMKDLVKQKLTPFYWSIYDATMSAMADDCRSLGIPLAGVIIPRAGGTDAPDIRGPTVAHLRETLGKHCTTVFDLSNTFDETDATKVEIATWDDHPNALGHHRLFRALAAMLVKDRLYENLFPGANQPGRETSRSAGAPGATKPGKNAGEG